MTEMLIIALLMVLNGVFSMSEAAVISARKARLQPLADKGSRKAIAAIKLADDPNRFLSTVQIGITLIGIVAGVFGGATVSTALEIELNKIPALAPYSGPISYGLVILATTYLSLIIGELVPKRLALRYPERIAAMVALPMRSLSKATAPIVTLLGWSTDAILWLMGIRASQEPPVSEEEIKAMIQQGVEAGVFVEAEHEMVRGVFRLGDRRVKTLMTPHTAITWLDVNDTAEIIHRKMIESNSSRFPICEGDLDHVVGVIHAKDLLLPLLVNQPLDLRTLAVEPIYVPETMMAAKALDLFKVDGRDMAIVVSEHGGLQGLVTIHDLLEEIVGETEETPVIVQREDGSWLLDGLLPIDEMKERLGIDDTLPGERINYETLGGFIMARLERIPQAADHFTWDDFAFEVMDMDGNRVDKVLVTRVEAPTTDTAQPDATPAQVTPEQTG